MSEIPAPEIQDPTIGGGGVGGGPVSLDSPAGSGGSSGAGGSGGSGGPCTENTAIDLGTDGNSVTVPNNGCVRVKDHYPSWWTTLNMRLENTSNGTYPVPFSWTNFCTGSSGSGTFTGDWQAFVLVTTSFGWDDACNSDKPFARFVTARVAMDVSSPWTQRKRIDRSAPFLDWALLWSTQVVEDLRARCAGEDAIAFYQPRAFASDYVALNIGIGGDSSKGYFYGQDVPLRVSILLHEATHWTGFDHVGNTGKDQRFGQNAFTTEVIWLSDYASFAFNAPRKLQCSAQKSANFLLASSFLEDPGFEIDWGACDISL